MSDADPTVRKRALRAEMRRIRRTITADRADRQARSDRIWARIVALADLGADRPGSGAQRARTPHRRRRVMLFEGLPTEPATERWFTWCVEHDIDAFVPQVDGPDLRVVPGDVHPAELDVVIVPGLAFTVDGRRLGQGGGHYDRFLTGLRADCVTIGACFTEQVLADIPTEPHDTPVNALATDD